MTLISTIGAAGVTCGTQAACARESSREQDEASGGDDVRKLLVEASNRTSSDPLMWNGLRRLAELSWSGKTGCVPEIIATCDQWVKERGAMVLPQVEALTWIAGDSGLEFARRGLREHQGGWDASVSSFIIVLHRLGNEHDVDLIHHVQSLSGADSHSMELEEILRDFSGFRERREWDSIEGELTLPRFLGSRGGSTPMIYQGIRCLREWPRSERDISVHDRVYRALTSVPASRLPEVMHAFAVSLSLGVAEKPVNGGLLGALFGRFVEDRHPADAGGLALDLIQHARTADLYSCLKAMDDAWELGTIIESLHESVFAEGLGGRADVLYRTILAHVDDFVAPSHVSGAAVWIVRTFDKIADRDAKELHLIDRVDLESMRSRDDPRLREIAQYLRWRLPSDMIPRVSGFSACDRESKITREMVAEMHHALSRWREARGYESRWGTFRFAR